MRARDFAELRLGDADAGIGGVAGRVLAVDVGLGDEAAADQRLRAVEFVLGEAASARATWIWAASWAGLLRLDRAVDDRQHLARADPLARLDQHRSDQAAFAGDADRHSRRAASVPVAVIVRATAAARAR